MTARGSAGSRNGNARLTTQQVFEIRASTDRQVELAARYNVTQTTISKIRLGQLWKDGPWPPDGPCRPPTATVEASHGRR